MDIKVSIIVPVYNAEKTLGRCMDSILAQTMKDIEVILVDDGSHDNSPSMCDEYSDKYQFVKSIHQKNTGIYGARKAGLKEAQGEYFSFVDADDYIISNMYEELCDCIERYNSKMIIFDMYEIRGTTSKIKKGYLGKNLTVENFYLDVTPGFLCNKIFHNSLKKWWDYSINISQAEDLCCTLPMVSYLEDEDLYYLDEVLYCYVRSDESNSSDDYFIENNCIIEYLASLKHVMKTHNSNCGWLVAFYCMNAMYWGLNNKRRNCFRADYLEFIQNELKPYVLSNECFSRFNNIFRHCSCEVIPKTIVYANFDNTESTHIEEMCVKSWEKYATNYQIIEINLENCDFRNAPQNVIDALEHNNYQYAEDYFKLQYLVTHGGIVLDKNCRISIPLGGLRANKVFFGYKDDSHIGSLIYGGTAKNNVLEELIDTYHSESIFNDYFIPLDMRIQCLLEGSYGLIPKGVECFLKTDKVKLYSFEQLYCRIFDNNITYIFDELQEKAELQGKKVIDNNILVKYIGKHLENHIDDKALRDQIETQQRQILELQTKLAQAWQAYENTVNSTSWKITAPVRKILDMMRRGQTS